MRAGWETFTQVRLPYALPFIVSAQEITGSGSIIVAIAAEWMISSTGLGYIINRAMQQYRGDQVYAVAFLAAILSFLVYALVAFIGERLNWQAGPDDRADDHERWAGRLPLRTRSERHSTMARGPCWQRSAAARPGAWATASTRSRPSSATPGSASIAR